MSDFPVQPLEDGKVERVDILPVQIGDEEVLYPGVIHQLVAVGYSQVDHIVELEADAPSWSGDDLLLDHQLIKCLIHPILSLILLLHEHREIIAELNCISQDVFLVVPSP